MDILLQNSDNKSIWTIETEFSCVKYKVQPNYNNKFIKFINKWLSIMLLRDDEFFKLKLAKEEYVEFINKINKYKNTFGESNNNISLYFSEYNFSDQLADKILTLRNQYGIMLIFLLAFPFDTFTDDLCLFSKELKNIQEQINLKSLLQEISFDLGCSSYAIGKFYDCVNKIYDVENLNTQNVISNDEFELYFKMVFKFINSTIELFDKKSSKYTVNEQEQIKLIINKQKNFLPLDFVMSNRILIYFIKIFFKL
jgi:hypothetical protein